MPYLTYEEYKGFNFTEISETEFNSLMNRASDVLDSITRYFYRHIDLESDVAVRKEQFKKALACQVEYFYDMGATNSHGLSEPAHIQIGRTSMSRSARNSTSQDKTKQSIVSDDVYMYLQGTGLLYAGLGVRS